jgi:hypothetical protein
MVEFVQEENMAAAKYKYRKEVVNRLRLKVERLTNKALITQFKSEYVSLALDGFLEQEDFPFIYLSGEVRLMFPAELYQVCKEELQKRGIPTTNNGAN